MSTSEARTLIGTSHSFGSGAAVYQVHDGLEIQSHEQYEVVLRRVLFHDVLMVSIHREVGALYLILTGSIAVFFLGIGGVIARVGVETWPIASFFGVIGAPALIAFLVRLFLGVDVVTIFGKRSKATVRFTWRKKRARLMYDAICHAVRNAHGVTKTPDPLSDSVSSQTPTPAS